MTFFERLEARVAARGSLLCVGLDPRVGTAAAARAFCEQIVAATLPHAAAFKPNSAFFEALGPEGMEVLAEVVASIPEEVPVLLDAKRGDIGSTAAAYAAAVFDRVGAGAVTVSPYLGADSVEPFLAHRDRGVFVLCRSSNPGGADFQEAALMSGELYLEVARVAAGWAGPDRLGLVVGATDSDALALVRQTVPEHWILAPGAGTQGGSLEAAVTAGMRADRSGLLLPVSRAIAEASDPATAAADLKDAIGRVELGRSATRRAPLGLALELFDTGCVCLGDFELKSGTRSPIYVDARMLSGHPRLLRRIARRFTPLLRDEVSSADGSDPSTPPAPIRLPPSWGGVDRSEIGRRGAFPDRIAGVPLGGLAIAAVVSVEAGIPMVYPRPEAKDHGTRSGVEGPFDQGDRVTVVDDVATSGLSVLEAVSRLRGEGLVVESAVVLIDRGAGARAALGAEGVELRAVLGLGEIVGSLRAAGRISDGDAARVREFLGR